MHFPVSDPKVLYETPIRVFAPVADTPLSMCDYMFQGEATTDSMERFRELLDLVVEPDTIELDAERIPSMCAEGTTFYSFVTTFPHQYPQQCSMLFFSGFPLNQNDTCHQ